MAQGAVNLYSNSFTGVLTVSSNMAVTSGVTNNVIKGTSGGLTLSGIISGGDSSTVLFFHTSTSGDGSTPFTLSGNNTFRANIRLNRGRLIVNHANALGNTANEVYLNSNINNTDGNLTFNLSGTFANPIRNTIDYDNTISTGGNDVVLTGDIYGSGGLTKLGSGKLTIAGNNTYSNGTTISAGTLQVGNGASGGTLGSGNITNNGVLIFNRSNAFTNANAISGSGSVRQIGSGTTVFSGFNTYSGDTTISSGTLLVRGGVTGSILVESGGSLDVTGLFSAATAGPVTVKAGGQVRGTGQISSLSVQSNGVVKIQTAATNATGAWNTAGTISFDPGSILDVSGLSLNQTSYTLVRGSSVSGTPVLQGAAGYTVANTSNSITLTAGPGFAQKFENTDGVTFPAPGNSVGNASPYPSVINVSGVTSPGKLTVRITGFSHNFPDEADIFLMSPSGQVCALLSDAGSSASGLNLTFDDAASGPAPTSSSLTSTTYRPTDVSPGESLPPGGTGTIGTSLQALLSGNLNGDWKLFVSDDTADDSGSFTSWSLMFEPSTDADGDGLSDGVETNTGIFNSAGDTGTDPNKADTDGDGLDDGTEVNVTGTNPCRTDTDGDGLNDEYEVNLSGTNPSLYDTDKDGFGDGAELAESKDPNSATSWPASSSRLLVWGETPFATNAVMATGVTQAVLAQVSTATNVIAVLKDGGVTTWSLTGSSLSAYTTPTNATSNVLMIAAGDEHILALKNNGQVLAWGRGFSNNSVDPEWGQSLVPSAATSGIVSIAAGGYHSLALRGDGRVVAWGRINYQQTDVPPAASNGVVAIAAGYYTSFALKSDGTVVGWGRGSYGATVPSDALSGVIAISAGRNHAMALKTNGIVKAWGNPPSDQVTTSTGAPVGLSGVTEISAGRYYSMALKADRILQAWGETDYAGDPFLTPPNLANVNFIQGARSHGLAIVSDGQAPRLGLPMAPIQIKQGASTNLPLKATVSSPTFSQLGLPAGVTLSSAGALTAASNAAITNAFVRIMVANSNGSDARVVNLQVTSGDTNPPTITLNGNALVLLESGDAYTDAGVTVTDNVDTSIVPTDELTGTGIFYPIPYDDSFGVTGSAGVYTITYRAQDAAGNQATPVTRTVKVFPNGYLAWANSYGLFGASVPDMDGDGDLDGKDNLGEFTAGTDPGKADTDGDGTNDSTDPYPLTANHNFDIYLGLIELCRQDSAAAPVPDYPDGVTSGAVFEKLAYATAPTGMGIARVEVRKGGSVVPGGDLRSTNPAGPGRMEFGPTNVPAKEVVNLSDSQWEKNLLPHGNYSFRGLSVSNLETTNVTINWNDGTGMGGAAVVAEYPAEAPRLTGTNWINGDLCLPNATNAVLTWSNNWTNQLNYGWIRVELERRLVTGASERLIQEIAVNGSNLPTQMDLGTKGFLTNNAHYTGKLIFSVWKDGLVRAKATRFHMVTGPQTPPTAPTLASLVAANGTNQVGPISTSDSDAGDSVELSLPAGSYDNNDFDLVGSDLQLKSGNFDRATKTSYRVLVRATDSHGLFAESIFNLTVPKKTQSITFSPIPPKNFGAAAFAANATAGSGLAVSYASSNPGVAIVVGGDIQILGAGTTDITASQAGNDVFEAATPVTQTLTVNSTGTAISSGSGVGVTGGITSASTTSAAPIVNLPGSMRFGEKISLPGAVQVSRVGESNLNLAIPDGNLAGMSLQLTLTGLNLSNYRLTVGLQIQGIDYGATLGDYYVYLRHNRAGDLVGQTRVLLNRLGTSGSDLVGSLADGINAIFADEATTNIQAATDPFSGPLLGTYQPASLLSGSSNGLNTMGSTDWNGTWTLFVADQQSGGAGNLVDWFMQFEDLSSASTTANTTDGLVYEVVDDPADGNDGTNKASINGNELEAKSGSGRITVRASYPGGTNWTTNTITLQAATQTITFTNRLVTVVQAPPFNLLDPGATASSGRPVVYTSSNTNVAAGGTNGVSILAPGVSTLRAVAPADDDYGAASEVSQVLTVLAPAASLPFREDFSSPGLDRFAPINYNWGSPLSLTTDNFLTNTNERLTFSSPRAVAAIAQPNLTLPLTNSWTVEATVNVPSSSVFHSVGLNLIRDLYQGGQYSPNDQLTFHYFANNGTKTVRSYYGTQTGDFIVLDTQGSSAASLRLALRYDHQSRQVTCLYRDGTNAPWQTNGVRSLATNGTIGTAWGLKETDLFRLGFFGETQNSTGTAGADLWVDDIYVQVQTLPELTLSGTLTGKVDEVLSGGYPVLFSGHPPITFTASNLPTGLTIGSTDGLITGTPTAGGSGTATVYASNSYGVVSTNLAFNIARASSSISVTDTNSFTYSGNPQGPVSVNKSGSSGAVTYEYEGTNGTSYTKSATKPTGAGQYTVVATLPGDSNYEGATSSAFGFTITQATPVISAGPTASAITYGQTLNDSALSGGTASVAGSFAFTTPTTAPNAGTNSVSVTFTPSDTANYTTATTNVSVVVNQAAASLSLSGLSQTYDGTAKSVTVATTPSALGTSVTYEGSTNPPTNAGSYTVVASVTEVNYTGSVTNTLVIAQATPVISAGPTASAITYGQTLNDSALSGGTAGVPGTFAFTTPSTAPNAGTNSVSVTFTPSDTANYTTATTNVSVVVNQALQTITFNLSSSSVLSSSAPFTLLASSSSGLTVTFETSSSSVATVSGNTLTIVGPGTVTITAKQAGNGNYEAATDVPRILTVVDANLPIAGADSGTTAPVAGSVIKFHINQLLANDDPSADPGDTRALIFGGHASSSLRGGTVSQKGSWIICQITAAAVSAGSDSFDYTVSNGTGTATGTVNITIQSPVALQIQIESMTNLAVGKRITFAVSPNTTFEVQATSDLANWTTLNAGATSLSDGRLVVDDPGAGSVRFYRVRWIP